MNTRIGRLLLAIAGFAALLLFPIGIDNPYYIHLLETIMIYAILLFGLDIVVGYTGQVSLGHAGLFGLGAYTAGVLVYKLGAPLMVALVASIGVTALFGALLVGLIDTLSRSLLPAALKALTSPDIASDLGPTLASILIYVLMATVLFFKPRGLFPARG